MTFGFSAAGADEQDNAKAREAIRRAISAIDGAEDLPDSLDQLEQQITIAVKVSENGNISSVQLLDQVPNSDMSWESILGVSWDQESCNPIPISRSTETTHSRQQPTANTNVKESESRA
jgi:hypothetical protein